ncbi:oxidoreductase [Shumkonia mesophila]|uniref:oxidoreductase n=1 Tax=Shumkonia mesophila TaxID=2838854 RepID=UPI002934E6DB|nr:FAD-dependent oxidoreductase [Shumkonia mesophila]
MRRFERLFDPITVGQCLIKNRFVMAPMGPAGLCDSDGAFTERGIDFYVERARGGVGLIITGMNFVENEVEKHTKGAMPCPTDNPMLFIRMARTLTERVHAYDARIFLQISAGFGRVSSRVHPGDLPVGPSVIPHRWIDGLMCRELSTDEVKRIIAKLIDAAGVAKRSGFDGVEIHAMHEGYLIDQFATELFNNRTDEYGGSLENRIRMAVEIVQGIKNACGNDFPVVMRYSPKSFIKELGHGVVPGEEFTELGRDLPEGLEVAKLLEKAGYDALDSDVGSYDSWYWSHPPMYQKKGLALPFNAEVKKVVDIPVITAGRMDNPELASAAIEKGQTDMIGLGRPLLADAQIVNKIRVGKHKRVRPCLSCHEACMGRLKAYLTISCAVNPSAGREREYALAPAAKKKRVMVIGGGVAGCESARVLALRGHDVQLFEKSGRLGGNLIPGGAPDFKEDDLALADWYTQELAELDVKVSYLTEVTPEMVRTAEADSVIIATGSKPRKFSLGNDERVYVAADVLTGQKDAGNTTVIIGGGLVGCETALMLVRQGKKVVIVEALDEILSLAGPLCYANREMLADLLRFHHVEIRTGTKAVRLDGQSLFVTKNGVEEKVTTDSVIIAVGYDANTSLYDALLYDIEEIYQVGDARKVSNIMYAIWDAFEVARNI